MDEFKDQVPQSTVFSFGYFEGRQSTKYWICTEQDLNAMYNRCHNEIMLWCDGHTTDVPTAKRSRPEGINTNEKRKKQRLRYWQELKERNADKMELTEPQYQLWACMITSGVHADKDVPPHIPITSGVTPKCKNRDDNKSDLQETIINTTAAVLKVVKSGLVSSCAAVGQSLSIEGTPASSVTVGRSGNLPLGVSPSKVTKIHGKSFEQLSALKSYFMIVYHIRRI